MKSFKQFLMESVRSYNYKIRICGEPDKNWLDMFRYNLQKFDPIKMGEAKTTPIQKEPHGFPHAKNQPVTMFEVEFKYPCTEPMVKQLARLLNFDENNVRMLGAEHVDSLEREAEQYANQASHSPVLTHTELEDAGKDAAKEYGEQYMSRIRKAAEEDKMDMPYAAPKTAPAKDMRQIPGNNKSPMTQITRQPKPETGASASRSK